MSSPIVSVIIPTYNYALYICNTIESVLNQDYPVEAIEIIVVDDGSTDNTKQVLNRFIQNNVIKYIYQENKGKSNATYKAIQNCSGKYIFNLDADDYFLQGKIRKTVEVFESDDSIVHVATPAKFIMADSTYFIEPIPMLIIGKVLDGNWLLKYLMNGNLLYGGGSTYAARASVLKNIKIPDAIDMYTDEFLILTTLPLGKSFFISDHLSVWRGHNLNYSGTSKTPDTKISKGDRMLASCTAVFKYLKENKFDKNLLKVYQLKNKTLIISHKEICGQKTWKDILSYAGEVFFRIRPGWTLVKRYHVINRLIPTTIFNFLKKSLVRSEKKKVFFTE